jgi:molybdate transport system regulatory protein
MKKIRVRSKVWLECEGQPFFGDGRLNLLMAINQTGSINAAAKELQLSYRKAWAQLAEMEKNSPFPLLKRRIGGSGGGQTLLTDKAQTLLKNFSDLCNEINSSADRFFAEIFPEMKI